MDRQSVYEQQLATNRKTGIPRLLEIAGTKKTLLIAAGLLSVIAVFAQIVPFLTIYLIVRELMLHMNDLQGIDTAYVWKLSWLTLAAISVFGIITYIANMLSHIAAFNILYEIRVSLAAKLARLPMGYFTSRTNGSIKKILHEDVERIELFVAHHIIDITQAVALPVIAITTLFFFDWRLGFGVLIPLPLAFAAQLTMFKGKGEDLYKQWQQRLGAMNGTIVEYVRGMPVVKIFNQSVHAFGRFAEDVYAYRDLTLHWIRVSATPFACFIVLLCASSLFILPIAILLVSSVPSNGYVDLVSTIFLFLYVGMGISLPIYKVMRLSAMMIMVKTGLSAIDDILLSPEIPEGTQSRKPADATIEFRDVSFAYNETEVLKNISFKIPATSIAAFIGPSGGGKSTIANLIGRFWDVGGGGIFIGGIDIRDLPIETLNATVSMVFQDVFLLFDTIEENIRMGNERATFEEVKDAAKAAQIHDFIETLPQKYRTLIGEGGTYLSGGEQQRISLARAILKNSPIVVLDEATAYADPENEARIQDALAEVLKNKTVVIIAHRLYTITDVDQILVIDNGTIAERGTHQELVNANGLYGELWDIHTKARDWNMGAKGILHETPA